MKAFIKLHGVYVGFWLTIWTVSMVGLYWAVRWAIVDAHAVIEEAGMR